MRLHAERDLLVTNKIIRKPKVLKDVSDAEFPSSIPIGWVRVRLNDIGDWGAGATPLRSRSCAAIVKIVGAERGSCLLSTTFATR